jgi:hypothetical protein
MKPRSLFLLALLTATSLAAQVKRQNVVVAVGEEIVYTTSASIATVSTPPGVVNDLVKTNAEQYGETLSIRGVKKGETKLLVESTAAKIAEVVNLTVTAKPNAMRYRNAVSALATMEGIPADGIFVANQKIVITGETFSAADHARCMGLETSAQGVTTVCAARMNSAAPAVVAGNFEVIPNIAVREEFHEAIGAQVAGSEMLSTWIVDVRLGDVPVLHLTSMNRAAVLDRAADFVLKLRKAAAEWRREAEQRNRIYPVTSSTRRTMTGYELRLTWRLDQGTAGEPLIAFGFDELENAARTSGTTTDRLVDWWSAILQDAFRLYFLAQLPTRTASASGAPIVEMYRNAFRLDSTPLNRANAALRLAKSYTSLRWSGGKDPFGELLLRVPQDYSGAAAGQVAP